MYKGPPYNSIRHSQEARDNHFPTLSQKLHHFIKMFKLGHFKSYGPPSDVIPRLRFEWANNPFYACMCKETQLGIFAHPHGHAHPLQPILTSIIHHTWTLTFCCTSRLGNHQIRQNSNQRGTPLGKDTRGWMTRVWSFEALFVACDMWQPS